MEVRDLLRILWGLNDLTHTTHFTYACHSNHPVKHEVWLFLFTKCYFQWLFLFLDVLWSLSLSRVFWFVWGYFLVFFVGIFSSFYTFILHLFVLSSWFFLYDSKIWECIHFFSLLTDSHSWRDSGNERFRENKPLCLTACTLTHSLLPHWSCPALGEKRAKVVRRLPGGFSPLGQTYVITIMVWGRGMGVPSMFPFLSSRSPPQDLSYCPLPPNIKCFKILFIFN